MYKIALIPSVQKDLDHFDHKIFAQIQEKVESLSENPRQQGSLKLTAQEGYRLRSGDFRILYRIDDSNKVVYIYRIKHRKDSYR